MKIILAIIFILSILPAFALEFEVSYLEGILELKENNKWIELEEGDVIKDTQVVKLSDNGFVELISDEMDLTFSKDGVYPMSKIVADKKEVFSWGMGDILLAKLNQIVSEEDLRSESVMGVRANKKEKEELEWIDESEQLLEEGIICLKEGEYNNAIEKFIEGAYSAIDVLEEEEYLFYQAVVYEKMNKKGKALKILLEIKPDNKAEFYQDYVLIKGHLLIENLAFTDALILFDEYLDISENKEMKQLVKILSFYCYKGLNNVNAAIKSLDSAYKIDPKSDYGIKALKLKETI